MSSTVQADQVSEAVCERLREVRQDKEVVDAEEDEEVSLEDLASTLK